MLWSTVLSFSRFKEDTWKTLLVKKLQKFIIKKSTKILTIKMFYIKFIFSETHFTLQLQENQSHISKLFVF